MTEGDMDSGVVSRRRNLHEADSHTSKIREQLLARVSRRAVPTGLIFKLVD